MAILTNISRNWYRISHRSGFKAFFLFPALVTMNSKSISASLSLLLSQIPVALIISLNAFWPIPGTIPQGDTPA
jgi:hypothetical protein